MKLESQNIKLFNE